MCLSDGGSEMRKERIKRRRRRRRSR